MIRRKW